MALVVGCHEIPEGYYESCEKSADCAEDLECLPWSRDIDLAEAKTTEGYTCTEDGTKVFEDTVYCTEILVCTMSCDKDRDCPQWSDSNDHMPCVDGVCDYGWGLD